MGCQGSKAVALSDAASHRPGRTLLAADAQAKMPANVADALLHSNAEFAGSGKSDEFKGKSPYAGEQVSHAMMRKHARLSTSRHEIDVVVSRFTSHDSTVGSAMGRNCKDLQWNVMFDIDQAPIEIALHVQEHKVHSNEVRVECNGQAIFQGSGAHAKSKMTEDFFYLWPIRGTILGINEQNYFEVHPSHDNSGEWYPATITHQGSDGYFEVLAQQIDAQGCPRLVKYPAIDKACLREASSKRPLMVPERSLLLHVPKEDPLKAVLSIDGEPVSHHLGRPSPCFQLEKPEIKLQVSRDRKAVTTDVGHSVLSQFVSGEVCSVKSELDRLAHSWTFKCGALAEHTVKILKKHTLSKIFTLMVDGEVFVESSAEDIDSKDNEWQCQFQFVGEKVLDFEVFKTNKDGYALDEIDHVKERRKYLHKCWVIVPNDWDLSTAQFIIDGTDFRQLRVLPQSHREEQALRMEPQVMSQSYGITVPYKVDQTAPSGMVCITKQILAQAEASKQAALGFFTLRCCESNAGAEAVEIVAAES